MKVKPIIIINGDPNSIFVEIFFKSLNLKKFNSPIILISSLKLIKIYSKKFKTKKKIKEINFKNIKLKNLEKDCINLIDVKLNFTNIKNIKPRDSNLFIKKSFEIGLELIKKGISNRLINGPITKKKFLKQKYLGITEYLASKNKTKKFAMLIYNEKLSVCPLTTHIPLKYVSKNITFKNIYAKVLLINKFYIQYKKIRPKIAILGLNPHCESIDDFNEDEKIIKPAVEKLSKSGFKVSGPFPADTIFLKKNREKFNVILGMYHDQVLSPLKTIYEYDAINITLGLPFLRISPDHGPNIKMVGKNMSNEKSLFNAINFLDKN